MYDSDLPAGVSEPIAYLDLEPLPGASTLSCYPDGMFYDGRTGVFSPATCPYGWTTVSLAVNTDQDEDEATTTALCCSSYVERAFDSIAFGAGLNFSAANTLMPADIASVRFLRFWQSLLYTIIQLPHTMC